MTVNERAWQMWPVLVWAARNQQTIKYRQLAHCTGMVLQGLGNCLEPIQSYCAINKFPALTSIVVDEQGMPGTGFTTAANVPKAQSEAFGYDWSKVKVP